MGKWITQPKLLKRMNEKPIQDAKFTLRETATKRIYMNRFYWECKELLTSFRTCPAVADL